jgi:hypothetical protein
MHQITTAAIPLLTYKVYLIKDQISLFKGEHLIFVFAVIDLNFWELEHLAVVAI